MSLLRKSDYAQVPSKVLHEYGACDVIALRKIYPSIKKQLKEQGVDSYYKNRMKPLVTNLTISCIRGMHIDLNKLDRLSRVVKTALKAYEEALEEVASEYLGEEVEFNPRSPVQLRKIIFEGMGLETERRTPTGQMSTDAKAIAEMAEATDNKFLRDLSEYRKIEKLRSTYIDGLQEYVDENDYVHPMFKVGFTKSGRSSAEHPAVTTIPRDKVYNIHGKEVTLKLREIFDVEDGYDMHYMDIKQGELLIAAILAGENKLVDLACEGEDLHDYAAKACIENCPVDENGKPLKEARSLAKAVNFGVIYLATPFGLAQSTGLEVEKIEAFMQKHRKDYPNLWNFLETVGKKAIADGHIISPFGRRKNVPPLPAVKSKDDYKTLSYLSHVEREFVNFLPQNGCAEVMNSAFNRMCTKFTKNPDWDAWPCNLVYDSIQVVGLKKYRKEIKRTMLKSFLQPIKELDDYILPCSYGVGENWSKAENGAKDYYKF